MVICIREKVGIVSGKEKKEDISRSEQKKYQDTMMADMGIQSLEELSLKERRKWIKALAPSKPVKRRLKEMGYSFTDGKNKRSLGSADSMSFKLKTLSASLNAQGFFIEAEKVERIMKIASIPGIDHPSEEIEIEGVHGAMEHLRRNPGMALHLDNPIGTKKWTIDGEKPPLPFHYGEVIEVSNPSDDMGWDVVIAPEASEISRTSRDGISYISHGHNLLPAGYIPVNSSRSTWKKNTSTNENPEGKEPPLGNDKIILAPDGIISELDRREVDAFFGKIWNFDKIVWL